MANQIRASEGRGGQMDTKEALFEVQPRRLSAEEEILPRSVAQFFFFSSLFFQFSSFQICLTGVTVNKPVRRFWQGSMN